MENLKKNSEFVIKLPLLLAIAICIGILVGAKMFGGETRKGDIGSNSAKLREILTYIDRYYVDTANTDELTDYAIKQMLEKLDPHTSFIPAKDMDIMGTHLNSYFEGIGVSFTLFKDTINIEAPVAGGPAESAGVQAGDKIITINGERVAGTNITTRGVYDRLLGKKGTQVTVSVARRGQPKLLDFTITRDKIPQYSVDVHYLLDAQTGYIRLSRFGSGAYDETKAALKTLLGQGMKQLVLDLRGNGGGYLDRAVNIADEFIPGDQMIVYTDGRVDSHDETYRSKTKGLFEAGPMIVLIDEESASASEILAGALQDNDRALLVGRRTFGKGLVQRPITLSDGSELRLTISRYFTPSGRSIQKPYQMGQKDQYVGEMSHRAAHGELYVADSNKFDPALKFKTAKGRAVYGGGGIMPDIFTPLDTSHYSTYFNKLQAEQVMREFALQYVQNHQAELKKGTAEQFAAKFEVDEAMLERVTQAAQAVGIAFNQAEYQRSKELIKLRIKEFVARNLWREEGWYRVSNQRDPEVAQARQLFGQASRVENGNFTADNLEKK
ncbi:MAG: S41 family peptidase [Bernardetiaceae bacterium]|nr:S41 family peptidase [Bernardetiaceae bacterium]